MPESTQRIKPTGYYLNVNGLTMYYEMAGSGPPLLLLHSGTATSQSWRSYLPALAPRAQVIMPDSRAHGRSDNPSGTLSYAAMADDIAALIYALDIARPVICGYGDGGQIALEVALRYPGLAQAYVLGAACYERPADWPVTAQALSLIAPGIVDTARIETTMPELVEQWRERHDQFRGADYWKTLLEQLATMWLAPLRYTADEMRQIREPALILLGDHDAGIPLEQAIELYRMLPSAELAIVPNADHRLVERHSDVFASLLLDFIARHTPAE